MRRAWARVSIFFDFFPPLDPSALIRSLKIFCRKESKGTKGCSLGCPPHCSGKQQKRPSGRKWKHGADWFRVTFEATCCQSKLLAAVRYFSIFLLHFDDQNRDYITIVSLMSMSDSADFCFSLAANRLDIMSNLRTATKFCRPSKPVQNIIIAANDDGDIHFISQKFFDVPLRGP